MFYSSLQRFFPSWIVVQVGIFFSILLFQWSSFYSFIPESLWCCSLHSSSRFEDRALFVLIHLTGVLCSNSSSFYLSSFASIFNLSAVWNPSYPLCHSFNTSGGSVLLDFIKYLPIFSSSCSSPSMFKRSASRILPLSSCFNRSGFKLYLVH